MSDYKNFYFRTGRLLDLSGNRYGLNQRKLSRRGPIYSLAGVYWVLYAYFLEQTVKSMFKKTILWNKGQFIVSEIRMGCVLHLAVNLHFLAFQVRWQHAVGLEVIRMRRENFRTENLERNVRCDWTGLSEKYGTALLIMRG